MWDRSRFFLKRAGTVILMVSIILWALLTFPRFPASSNIQLSWAGQIGTWIEPAIRPLGFDWRIGIGLLSAQAAREVIISTMATIYRVGAPGEHESLTTAIQAHLSPLAAISLMVYFAFALQCTSTLAIARRETGGWKWPLGMFLYMTLLAYCSSLVVFQLGKALGFGG
jgi:ferrous iron transport protein B